MTIFLILRERGWIEGGGKSSRFLFETIMCTSFFVCLFYMSVKRILRERESRREREKGSQSSKFLIIGFNLYIYIIVMKNILYFYSNTSKLASILREREIEGESLSIVGKGCCVCVCFFVFKFFMSNF